MVRKKKESSTFTFSSNPTTLHFFMLWVETLKHAAYQNLSVLETEIATYDVCVARFKITIRKK